MKKALKAVTTLLLIIGIISVSCAVTSCATSTSANRASYNRPSNNHVVKRNYKVKGTQKRNNATYRTY